jgi:hypothetical protein
VAAQPMEDPRQTRFQESLRVPLTGLVRVIASGLSCSMPNGVRLTILSIELYGGGFVARYQLEYDQDEHHVMLPEFAAWDDVGTEYWAVPGAVDTAAGVSRGEVRVVPGLSPLTRVLTLVVEGLISFVPGAADTPSLLRPPHRPKTATDCQITVRLDDYN